MLKSAAADKSYSVYFDRGSELYESQDYDSALAYLRKAASKDKTVECVLLMSRCYERLGNIDKALELLRGMDTQDAQISARINELEALRRAQQEAELVEIAGEKYQLDSSGLVADNAGLRDADLDNVVRLRALSSLSIADNSITDIAHRARRTDDPEPERQPHKRYLAAGRTSRPAHPVSGLKPNNRLYAAVRAG